MPEFSVIVPVYNVENYVGRCIESILAQTFADFELILVDDGSSDKSGSVCEQYAVRDHRIHVIHQENKGVSAARNTGLKIATGKYVVFVDSDDTIETNYLSAFAEANAKADLVVCGVKQVSPLGIVSQKTQYENEMVLELTKEETLRMIDSKANCFVYDKRFKRQILAEKNIRFDEKITLGEDTYFVALYLCMCKTVQYIIQAPYCYYIYEHVTLSNYDEKSIQCLAEAYKKIQIVFTNCFENIDETMIWKKQFFDIFPYGIFGILRDDKYSNIKKYQMLKTIVKMDRFEEFVREIDIHMQQDSKFIRKVIATGKPVVMLSFWKLLDLWNGLKHIFSRKDML